MADERAWLGRDPSSLSDAEVEAGYEYCDEAYNRLKSWAPIAVWSFFASLKADLAIEAAKRGRKRNADNRVPL